MKRWTTSPIGAVGSTSEAFSKNMRRLCASDLTDDGMLRNRPRSRILSSIAFERRYTADSDGTPLRAREWANCGSHPAINDSCKSALVCRNNASNSALTTKKAGTHAGGKRRRPAAFAPISVGTCWRSTVRGPSSVSQTTSGSLNDVWRQLKRVTIG